MNMKKLKDMSELELRKMLSATKLYSKIFYVLNMFAAGILLISLLLTFSYIVDNIITNIITIAILGIIICYIISIGLILLMTVFENDIKLYLLKKRIEDLKQQISNIGDKK